MVAVSLSEKKGFHEVNRIASAYGRNNMGNYLDKQLNQGNLIAANQERAEELLNTMGLQLPDEKHLSALMTALPIQCRVCEMK